mmetsp:Transcript_10582/g.43852  ORF Transcript_10582/g.43852 Transcript_10582/m.43852 type:complete len:349 (+) Transcript_10582:443-1489(+)
MRAGVRARDLGNRVPREKPGRAGAVVAGMDRKRRGLASSLRLSSRVPVGVFTNDAAHGDDDDGRERGSVSKREDRRERDVPGADEAFRLRVERVESRRLVRRCVLVPNLCVVRTSKYRTRRQNSSPSGSPSRSPGKSNVPRLVPSTDDSNWFLAPSRVLCTASAAAATGATAAVGADRTALAITAVPSPPSLRTRTGPSFTAAAAFLSPLPSVVAACRTPSLRLFGSGISSLGARRGITASSTPPMTALVAAATVTPRPSASRLTALTNAAAPCAAPRHAPPLRPARRNSSGVVTSALVAVPTLHTLLMGASPLANLCACVDATCSSHDLTASSLSLDQPHTPRAVTG